MPLAIDLFCGLGGWTDGLLAEGYDVVGFDIERHDYGTGGYPAQLVLQDALTIHGSQFRNAALIVASPPCQAYSYMAMPWKLAKAKAAAIRADTSGKMLADLNALFNACFRIQREACEAAGRYIPMVVENVKGAQPWVGPAKANFGSFYLWGDVAMVGKRVVCGAEFGRYTKPMKAQKVPGFNFHEFEKTGQPGRSFQTAAVDGIKGEGSAWFNDHKRNGVSISSEDRLSYTSSKSSARKAASAQIAKIPLELSRYVARCYFPKIII